MRVIQTIEVKASEAIEVSEAVEILTEPAELSEDQKRLVVLAEDTRTRMKRTGLDIYHIGANLLEAQRLLAHGEFLPWIGSQFDMSQRSAYKFMSVAKAFQGKFAQNANFEIAASALYLLASSDTPESARDEVVELAEAGEVVTTERAREIIEKHTPAASRKSRAVSPNSDRSGAESPQMTEQPATHGFIPGAIARVSEENHTFYGKEVQVTIVHDENIVVCKRLDNGDSSILREKDLKLLPRISPSHLIHKITKEVALPDDLAIDLLTQIFDDHNVVMNLSDQLEEEVSKILG